MSTDMVLRVLPQL